MILVPPFYGYRGMEEICSGSLFRQLVLQKGLCTRMQVPVLYYNKRLMSVLPFETFFVLRTPLDAATHRSSLSSCIFISSRNGHCRALDRWAEAKVNIQGHSSSLSHSPLRSFSTYLYSVRRAVLGSLMSHCSTSSGLIITTRKLSRAILSSRSSTFWPSLWSGSGSLP